MSEYSDTPSREISVPPKLTRVKTSGDLDEYIHLGEHTFLKSEVQYAFGGNLNPGATATSKHRIGNPTPMGLFAFAVSTLLLSLINAGSRKVHNPGVVLGTALFHAGVVEIIAGVWELVLENTFGATVFTTFGGFWMSYAVITMDGFNIASAYEKESDLHNALGLYLVVWALVSLFFTMCCLRSTVAMFSLLLFLTLTFIMLASSNFTAANGSVTTSGHLGTAGGIFGCISAMCGFYMAMAGILNYENSWIDVKPLFMPGAIRPPSEDKPKEA